MKLKAGLVFLMVALSILTTSFSVSAAASSYQFDWNLYPLEFTDNRYYILKVVDERPDGEKNPGPESGLPFFSSIELETNLKAYLTGTLPVTGDKSPVILKIKSLKFSNWATNGEDNAKIELILEFDWKRDGEKNYETEIVSIKKQASQIGLHEKHLSQVLASGLKSFSYYFDKPETTSTQAVAIKDNVQKIPEPINPNPATTNNENENKPAEGSSESSNPKPKKKKQDQIYNFTSIAPAGLGIGNIEKNIGLELSLCYLPQTKQSLGLDVFYAFPLGKYIYVSFGTGIYGHIDIDWSDFLNFLLGLEDYDHYFPDVDNDQDKNDEDRYKTVGGNFVAIQFYNEKIFIGAGHHSLKGYFIEFGTKIGK